MRFIGPRSAAEIEQMAAGVHVAFDRAPQPKPHRREQRILDVRAVILACNPVERALRFGEGGYDVHGACLHPVFSEHTQRSQVALVSTHNDCRNVRNVPPTMSASGVERILPIGSWKKQGLT